MLGALAPRPPRCYDPATPPHRDAQGVHIYDYATVRALLRDPRRVTSDVTEALSPAERAHLHPVSSFVWATDRFTLSGCPGRHAGLRSAMAPWFTPHEAADRQPAARLDCERRAAELGGSFDVFDDYALPVVRDYLADWLGIEPSDVQYAVDDQLAMGDTFADWPPLASPEMDDHYRALMARPGLRGVTAATRDMAAAGRISEREAWGIPYSISVSAVATATAAALAVGLSVRNGIWDRMTDRGDAGRAVEESVRLGSPFPESSRFAREHFTVGDVVVEPGEQVLLWLTAANRGLPGPHRTPLDEFDPWRDLDTHLGWGSGYHLCAGVHHARGIATTAVTALAAQLPDLDLAGPWTRFVGVDDGFSAAPAVATRQADVLHRRQPVTR
jgi:cytochrome P450